MLNPLRDKLSLAGRESQDRSSPFRVEAESALSLVFGLPEVDLERQVRRGDLTVKVARERAAAASARPPRPAPEGVRGVQPDPSGLPRSPGRGRQGPQAGEGISLDRGPPARDQQAAPPAPGRAAVAGPGRRVRGEDLPPPDRPGASRRRRSMACSPSTGPSSDSGDEVALEWSRRQLEGIRNRVFNDDDLRKIDLATDRPDRVNPRLIDVYVEAMKDRLGATNSRPSPRRRSTTPTPTPASPPSRWPVSPPTGRGSAGSARSSPPCPTSPTPP